MDRVVGDQRRRAQPGPGRAVGAGHDLEGRMQAGDRPAHFFPVVGGIPGRQIGAQAERELRLDQAEREVPGRQLGRALVDALPEQAAGKRPVDAEQVLDLIGW